MKFRILAIATFVIALAATFVPAAPASAAPAGEFLSDINGLRASKGLPALSLNSSLSSFAQGWTEKMAAAGKISHNPSLSSAPGKWTTVGENVGVGGSAQSIFDALVASSGHYANMVNAKYNAIGIGVTVGADGRIYTTHNFAAYPSSGSSSGTKSAPTTAKPAPTTAKPATTSAPKSNPSSAPTTTNTPAATAPSAQAAPTTPTATEAPALPIPSERIVQGLVEVGNISTQG